MVAAVALGLVPKGWALVAEVGDTIAVWLGAISSPSYWEKTGKDRPGVGDGWVECRVLEVLPDGFVVAERKAYTAHTNKIRPDHWREWKEEK